MKFLRAIVAALAVLCTAWPAHAQNTKSALTTILTNCFPTQLVGAIMPPNALTCYLDMLNSWQQYPGVNPQTGTTYTLQPTDYGQLVTFNNSSPIAVTLPQAIGNYFPWNVYIHNIGAGTVTVTPAPGTLINGTSSLSVTTGQSTWIVSDGTNYQIGNTGSSSSSTITIGSTGISGGTPNGLLYDSAGAVGNLATGNNGVLVTSSGGVPSISTTLPSGLTAPNLNLTGAPTGVGSIVSINSTNCQIGSSCTIALGLTINSTAISGGTSNGLLYNNAGDLGNLGIVNNAVLITNGSGVPVESSTLPSTVQGNITGTGTLTSGATGSGFTIDLGASTESGLLPLSHGGTNANLTASNGGILYSTASAFAVLSGTGIAGLCLQSETNAAPVWASCSGGASVASVANSDGTLTISPTTGSVVASIALGHANSWSAAQTFAASGIILTGSSTGTTTFTSGNAGASNFTLTFPAVTSTVAVLGQSQTFTGTQAFSGTLNASGTFQIGGTAVALPISLANGGTNASLSASNGGVFYSTGSAAAILSGTVTSGQCLLSGSNAAPSWGSCSSVQSGGHINKFRNGTFGVWQRGTAAMTVGSSGNYAADGWKVFFTGSANVTALRAAGNGDPLYALEVEGAASNTDIKIGQRIESIDAAPMASQVVTVQFQYYQNTGSTVTPKISTCYASSTDNFGTCTSDLGSISLTACATATWCTEAYTLTVSANAGNGYEIDFDCNAAFTSSSVACFISAADVRVTTGVSTGVNTSPPPPELRSIQEELAQCQRYFASTYGNNVAGGTAQRGGMVGWYIGSGTNATAGSIQYPVALRTTASSISFWDGAGNASDMSYYFNGSWTDSKTGGSVPLSGASSTNGFIAYFTGTYSGVESTNLLFHYQASAEL
jgi:hypothetical protein